MNPSWNEEKQFGRVVGTAFLALGAWGMLRGNWPMAGPVLAAVGLLLAGFTLLAPEALRQPRRLWMGLAEVLGFVSSRVILGVVFIGLVTPLGLLAKLRGRDTLGRRSPDAGSRWQPYPVRQHNPRHFEKMY
jgi:saxitoxin biosynthesis operon SxtJ-like protein